MESERNLSRMLEAIKMNPKFHEQLLKDVAFGIMMDIYPEYDEAQRKTRQEMGFKSPGEQPVSDIDYATEKQGLEFVKKLVNLGSLDAIRQYCDEHQISEYFPKDIAGYISQTYTDMQEESSK
jgi:hypothetical protein